MEYVSLLRSMFITVLPSRRIKYRYENWQYRSCQWIKVYIEMKSLLFRRTGITWEGIIIFQQKVSITARMSIKLCQTSTIAVWRLNRFQILLLVRWGPFFGHVHSILDIWLFGFRANDQYFLSDIYSVHNAHCRVCEKNLSLFATLASAAVMSRQCET